jgi:hypothetical protein
MKFGHLAKSCDFAIANYLSQNSNLLYLMIFFCANLLGIALALVWWKMKFWGEDRDGYAVLSQS